MEEEGVEMDEYRGGEEEQASLDSLVPESEDDNLVSEDEDEPPASQKDQMDLSYLWVGSKQYWQVLIHVAVTVVFLVGCLILVIAAPGLWKDWQGVDGSSNPAACSSSLYSDYSAPPNAFSFADVTSGLVDIAYPALTWVETQDGEGWVTLEDAGLVLYYYDSTTLGRSSSAEVAPQSRVLYPISAYPEDAAKYILSPDSQYILFAFDYRQLYRHSYHARWQVCSVSSYVCQELVEDFYLRGDVRLVSWSPVNTLSYVLNNNLFVVLDPANVAVSTQQVTFDGVLNAVINGAPDWVYEEEVLETNSASFWSPDGSYLAYLRFNEAQVPEYSFPLYNSPEQYPDNYVYKFPCVGRNNSAVSLLVYNLRNLSSTTIVGSEIASGEAYLTRVEWVNMTSVAFRKLDRLQQTQLLYFGDAVTGQSKIITTLHDSRWIDQHNNLLFPPELPGYFVDMVPSSNYNHLLLYNFNGEVETELTRGKYDVESVVAYDSSSHTLYFTSREHSVQSLNLYSVNLYEALGQRDSVRSGDVKILAEPATQRLSPEGDGFYSASFSPSTLYYALYTLGPDVPFTDMRVTSTGHVLYTLEDNNEARDYLSTLALPSKTMETFLSADGSTSLSGFVYYPPGFVDDGSVQYPVLLHYYGGPESQMVSTAFEDSFWTLHYYLSSSLGFLVVTVDNRGTCCYGQNFMKQTYLQLGLLETEDQLAVLHQLEEKAYVDQKRMAVWGWSFGGYLTSRLASAGDPIVAAAMSVAPVTHWKFYDTVYTERYMQTVESNGLGYNETAVLGRAGGVGETALLQVHGTGDDNVHFQNTADWLTELQNAGVSFQTMIYPDKTHSILGDATRLHLYNTLVDFLCDSLSISREDASQYSVRKPRASSTSAQPALMARLRPRMPQW